MKFKRLGLSKANYNLINVAVNVLKSLAPVITRLIMKA